MNILDNIKYAEDKVLNQQVKSKKGAFIWLISEIAQIVVFVLGSIFLLWAYAPFSGLAKLAITFLSLIIIYDVFKSFVWVRWVLIKEDLKD
jgi:hypothetical protein